MVMFSKGNEVGPIVDVFIPTSSAITIHIKAIKKHDWLAILF